MKILRSMTHGIRDKFIYRRRVEKGVQTPDETLRSGGGSCRDFAVLMMEAARSLGIATRFVSGYIFVPESSNGNGGGATHAWIQAYLPGAGWIDFDPTNSIVGNRNLIRVGVAWTPDQVLPLWVPISGARRPSRVSTSQSQCRSCQNNSKSHPDQGLVSHGNARAARDLSRRRASGATGGRSEHHGFRKNRSRLRMMGLFQSSLWVHRTGFAVTTKSAGQKQHSGRLACRSQWPLRSHAPRSSWS